MMFTGLLTLIGSLLPILGKVFDFFDKRQANAHELELARLETARMEKIEGMKLVELDASARYTEASDARELERMKLEAATSADADDAQMRNTAMQSMTEGLKYSSRWAVDLTTAIRPLITILAIMLVGWIVWQTTGQSGWLRDADGREIIFFVMDMCGGVINFWFGNRGFRRI